jgi:hypothetical protein
MANDIKSPTALFDTLENINNAIPISVTNDLIDFQKDDYKQSISFLKSYKGSRGTFNSYRREVERLLHWSWIIANKSIKDLRCSDIEAYLAFCQKPPISWIGTKKLPRFGDRGWRPRQAQSPLLHLNSRDNVDSERFSRRAISLFVKPSRTRSSIWYLSSAVKCLYAIGNLDSSQSGH